MISSDRVGTTSAPPSPVSVGRIVALAFGFVVAGALFVGYVWSALSELLALSLPLGHALRALAVLVVFLYMLRSLAKALRRLDDTPSSQS